MPTPHRPISPRAAASPPAVLTPRRPSLRPALSCPQPRSPARSEAAVPPPCFGAHSRGGRNLTRTDARLPIPQAAPRPVSCLGRSRAVACRSRPRAWGRRPPPPWAVGRLSNARRSEPAGPHLRGGTVASQSDASASLGSVPPTPPRWGLSCPKTYHRLGNQSWRDAVLRRNKCVRVRFEGFPSEQRSSILLRGCVGSSLPFSLAVILALGEVPGKGSFQISAFCRAELWTYLGFLQHPSLVGGYDGRAPLP